jgi:hypothetical protein
MPLNLSDDYANIKAKGVRMNISLRRGVKMENEHLGFARAYVMLKQIATFKTFDMSSIVSKIGIITKQHIGGDNSSVRSVKISFTYRINRQRR